MVNPRIKSAFDKSAPGYEAHAGFQNEICENLAGRIASAGFKNAAALDIGCGTGSLSRRLAASGAFRLVLASDISGGMIRAARAGINGSASPPRFALAEAERLPVKNGSLDLVASNLVLHWVENIPEALAQIRNALKPGGQLMAAVLGRGSFIELREATSAALRRCGRETGPAMFHEFVDEESLASKAREAGFSVDTQARVYVRWFESPAHVMRTLKRQGVQNSPGLAFLGLGRRAVMRAFEEEYRERFSDDGGARLTYEVIYVDAVRD